MEEILTGTTIETTAVGGGMEDRSSMNPFPGLRPFDIWENYLFFGRDRQVDALLKKLSDHHFVAVVGTSGSGKSSLVRAGLLPALYGGYMVSAGSTWHVAVMRPGSSPIQNLAEALSEEDVFGATSNSASPTESIARRAAILESSSLGLVQLVRQAALPSDENLLLVVDQFEELFRFKQNKSIADAANEATAFVKLLLEAVHQRQLSIYVLLTLRSDFLGDCAQFRDLPEAINEGHYLIPRLLREQQREAILGPVAVGGGKISPRLVQQLLNDLGDNPDQLPIMQHALMRTWDKWEHDHDPGEPIDFRHYEAIGRMQHALSEHADEAYNELPNDRSKMIAEAMFKCLTMRGPDNRGIRRPTKIAEICAIAGAEPREVIEVVEYFRRPGRSFIMPPHGVELTTETVLDISHESLMRVWDRLVKWVDDDAVSAQMYLRLVGSADLYAKEQAGLWRDPELQQAVNWRDTHKPNAAWANRYSTAFGPSMQFLTDSVKQREQELIEKRRRRRLVNAFIVAFLAFAGVLTVWALTERSSATRNAASAERLQKVAQDQEQKAEKSAIVADEQKRTAIAASQEAEAQKKLAEQQRASAIAEKQNAENSRADAERSSVAANEQRAAAQAQSHIADSMKNLAEKSASDVSRLRYLSIAKALAVKAEHLQSSDPDLSGLLALQAYRFTHDNGGPAMDPDIFGALHSANNRLNGPALTLRGPHGSSIRSIVYKGSQKLISASTDGKIVEWNSGTPHVIGSIASQGDRVFAVRTLALSPDGSTLCAAGDDRKLHFYSFSNDTSFSIPVDISYAVQIEYLDNSTIAVLDNNGHIQCVNAGTGKVTGTIKLSSPIHAFAISHDAQLLAAGDGGGTVGLWNLESLSGPPVRTGQADGSVSALAFSSGSASSLPMLAAGTLSGSIFLWNSGTDDGGEQSLDKPHVTPTTEVPIHSIAFSPDGRLLASGSSDGKVRLWNPARMDDFPITLADNSSWMWALAFSPDGKTLAASSTDKSVHLIPVQPDAIVNQIQPDLKRNLTQKEWDEFIGTDIPYAETIPELRSEK